MDVSQMIQSSHASAISPDGVHVATLIDNTLQVRRISTLALVRSVDFPSQTNSRFICIRWSPLSRVTTLSDRFLVSDEDVTHVWDLNDPDWSAIIDNGTGGMGRIANVEFGCDDSEVMVHSQLGARITVWSLWTGKGLDLKDPKFLRGGHSRKGKGRDSIFALLTRPAAQDVISLHAAGTYGLVKSFTPQTIDAQGLRWSPNGRWLAVWDAPSTGYKVLIYTADGYLYRSYRGDYFDDDLNGLGIRSIEWSPNGDFLLVAGYEKTVTLLSTKTFSPAVHLYHPQTIRHSKVNIWQESITSTDRSYQPVLQDVTPPAAPTDSDAQSRRVGVSIVGFSEDGSFLATKEDSMPTAVFIWDLSRLSCAAVLLQHSLVKKFQWHPTHATTLLVQCVQGNGSLYLWDGTSPRVLSVPGTSVSGKAEAKWVHKQAHKSSVLLLGDNKGFVLVYPEGKGAESSKSSSADLSEREDSDDSLYEILSGRRPGSHDDPGHVLTAEDIHTTNNALVEDTFQYRQGVNVH